MAESKGGDPPARDDRKILTWLKTQKYRDLADLRDRERGALWVITDRNPPTEKDQKFFEQAQAKGYDFRFVARGSKATKKRPAWYWEPQKKRPNGES